MFVDRHWIASLPVWLDWAIRIKQFEQACQS